jgi:hypothetical protein
MDHEDFRREDKALDEQIQVIRWKKQELRSKYIKFWIDTATKEQKKEWDRAQEQDRLMDADSWR